MIITKDLTNQQLVIIEQFNNLTMGRFDNLTTQQFIETIIANSVTCHKLPSKI